MSVRGDRVLRKWAFLISTVAAVAVIGCGGGGGGTSNGSGGGNNGGGGNLSSVNLPAVPGLVSFQYLTGQGRAPNSLVAKIDDITLTDVDNQIVDDPLTVNLQLGLNVYSNAIGNVDVPVAVGANSRVFNQFELKISTLSDGNVTYTGPGGQNAIDTNFDATFLAQTGRQTILPVLLDDQMITVDISGNPVLDTNLFQSSNYDPIANRMLGFYSDYVQFDLSGMATSSKPSLSGGSIANRVYFSGDNIAISEGGSNGVIEVLTPTGIIGGTFTPKITNPIPAPGTYTLLANDPRDVTNTAKIASLAGIYRSYTEVFANVGTFEAFVFPNTAEDLQPDCVMFTRDGNGNITSFYFGGIDYDQGTVSIFPINQVVTGDSSNEIDGTISAFKDANGNDVGTVATSSVEASVRTGTFTLSNPPAGFPATGRFLVFRTEGTDATITARRAGVKIARPNVRRPKSLHSLKRIPQARHK